MLRYLEKKSYIFSSRKHQKLKTILNSRSLRVIWKKTLYFLKHRYHHLFSSKTTAKFNSIISIFFAIQIEENHSEKHKKYSNDIILPFITNFTLENVLFIYFSLFSFCFFLNFPFYFPFFLLFVFCICFSRK